MECEKLHKNYKLVSLGYVRPRLCLRLSLNFLLDLSTRQLSPSKTLSDQHKEDNMLHPNQLMGDFQPAKPWILDIQFADSVSIPGQELGITEPVLDGSVREAETTELEQTNST